jgi:hypothetical protein
MSNRNYFEENLASKYYILMPDGIAFSDEIEDAEFIDSKVGYIFVKGVCENDVRLSNLESTNPKYLIALWSRKNYKYSAVYVNTDYQARFSLERLGIPFEQIPDLSKIGKQTLLVGFIDGYNVYLSAINQGE